jgi:hypothetical protein
MSELAAIAVAHSDNPLVLEIAAWLGAGGDGALYAHLVAADALPGYSQRLRATLAQRDDWLRELGGTPKALHKELNSFKTRVWPRDRLKRGGPCPYSTGDRRAVLWAILNARDHVPSERTIRRILAKRPDHLAAALQ